MGKIPLKVMRKKRDQDLVSFDAQMSADKCCYNVRAEAGKPTSYWEFLHLLMGYCHQEIKAMEMAPDDNSH